VAVDSSFSSAGQSQAGLSAGMNPPSSFGSPPSMPFSVTTGRNSHIGSWPFRCSR
jgi:hypothetical protein